MEISTVFNTTHNVLNSGAPNTPEACYSSLTLIDRVSCCKHRTKQSTNFKSKSLNIPLISTARSTISLLYQQEDSSIVVSFIKMLCCALSVPSLPSISKLALLLSKSAEEMAVINATFRDKLVLHHLFIYVIPELAHL